jgi:hypothetical protein
MADQSMVCVAGNSSHAAGRIRGRNVPNQGILARCLALYPFYYLILPPEAGAARIPPCLHSGGIACLFGTVACADVPL